MGGSDSIQGRDTSRRFGNGATLGRGENGLESMDLKPRTKSQHVTESGKWAESLRSLISRDDFWYALKQEHRQLSFLLTLYPELQRLARNAPTGERFVKDLERLRSRRARKFGIPEAELVRFEDLFRWPQRPSISQLKAASYAGDQFGLLFPKTAWTLSLRVRLRLRSLRGSTHC